MKYMLRGELQTEAAIYEAVAGVRCDELVLSMNDVSALYAELKSGSEVRREALTEAFAHMLCRFVPVAPQ